MAVDAGGDYPWRVRIYDASGAVRGAGVLVSDEYIITCAHVVSDDGAAAAPPEGEIAVDFPMRVKSLGRRTARVAADGWFPVVGPAGPGAPSDGDIAVLRLTEPVALPSAPLTPARRALNKRVWAVGHSEGTVGHGLKAFARVAEKPTRENDWVQLVAADAVGPMFDHGFSGAGVVDEETDEVLGILVAAYFGNGSARAAWMLPVETIERYWQPLRRRIEGADRVISVAPIEAVAVDTCSPWPDSHEISVVTDAGRLLRRWWSARDGWTHWYDARVPQPAVDVAAVPGDEGFMESIAVDAYGRLHRARHRDRWRSWVPVRLPDDFDSPVIVRAAAVSDGPGHGELFAVTEAGELVHRWRRGGAEEKWSSWAERAVPVPVQDVGAACGRPGQMFCAVVDVYGRCWRSEYADGWSDWYRMHQTPNTPSPALARIAAASLGLGHLEIFAVTRSGDLVHRWHWESSGWSRWATMKTPTRVVDVAAGSQKDGTYECVIVDVDGESWFARFSSRDWSEWKPFTALPIAAE